MKTISKNIFKYRSYTPIPFVIAMFIFQESTATSLIIGFAIALVGELFRFWGVSYAGSETRTTGGVGGTYLVVSGAYSYVRNPLYLGNLLLYMGIGIMSMAFFPYLQIIAFIFFYFQYHVIIGEEEIFLSEKFSDSYKDYHKSVPKLIPSLRPYKNSNIEQPPLNIKAGIRSERRTLQAFSLITLILFILFLVA